jgi:hypothetical protein
MNVEVKENNLTTIFDKIYELEGEAVRREIALEDDIPCLDDKCYYRYRSFVWLMRDELERIKRKLRNMIEEAK